MDVNLQLIEINGLHKEFLTADSERDDQRDCKNNWFH